MANVHVTIKNLPQIRAAFMMSPALMAKELEVAIAKSIFAIQADSMRNAPVDTGRLRASHQARLTPLKGVLEPMTNYAFFVHDGTKYMPARPFLAEAVQTNEAKVNDYFKKAVNNVFKKIGRSV